MKSEEDQLAYDVMILARKIIHECSPNPPSMDAAIQAATVLYEKKVPKTGPQSDVIDKYVWHWPEAIIGLGVGIMITGLLFLMILR